MSWLLPILAALAAWWAGTLTVLVLSRIGGTGRRLALRGGWVLAGLLVPIVILLHPQDSPAAAYLGFAVGLALWGWQELLFLQGVATGSRKEPSRRGRRGLGRVREAVEAVSHHEAGLFATLLILAVVSIGAALPVALWTFGALWVLRLSAKLNLFYGVPHPNGHLFPPRIRHLASFLGQPRRSIPLLVCIGGWFGLATGLFISGVAHDGTGLSTALLLLAGLVGLGALEHLAFLFRLPLEELWGWDVDDQPQRPMPRDRKAIEGLF